MKKIVLFTAALMLGTTMFAYLSNEAYATCNGSSSCNACKNCKYCKHCAKDGGSCGICK